MEGDTKEKGVCSHGSGADGTNEASWQTSQGDGADTRKRFVVRLHDELIEKGIHTFMDNVDSRKGERVDNLFGYI
ncbi:hypothetical protein EJ110_NYTH18262 [Nymphaea thermarum]|nr:hypothetical protein EJ110_NYTH18262 [Nymphaea thermarum]